MVLRFESSFFLCFGEDGRRKVAFPLCAVFEHRGSVWIRMLNTLKLSLGPFEQTSELPRVTNITMTFELNTNLDGPVTPDVSANAPVERVFEIASVERLDVRLVSLRESRCASGGSGRRCVA